MSYFHDKNPVYFFNTEKDWFDYSLGIITILGAIIAGVYTLISIRKLYMKDEDKQIQINRLASIAEKIEAQNDILKESNQLMSRQIEALQALSIHSSNQDAANKLLQIEEEKRELEYRPKLFSNLFSTAINTGSFLIENGGKQISIDSIQCNDQNIILTNQQELQGKIVPERGVFRINTKTFDSSVMNNKNYNIEITCVNDLGLKYKIILNSLRMESLRQAIKVNN